MKRLPSAALLREWLSYCPETGVIRWLQSPRYGLPAGSLAGTTTGREGYLSFSSIRGYRSLMGHRVAWAIHYGEWPAEKVEIDHINGIRTDNRISNLRLATRALNHVNAKPYRNSRSGLTGVLRLASGRWMARQKRDGRVRSLGTYDTAEAAVAARTLAAREIYGDFVPAPQSGAK